MQIQTIAEEVFEAVQSVTQIKPFSERGILFSPTVAYAVAQRVADMRGGEKLGRKMGSPIG